MAELQSQAVLFGCEIIGANRKIRAPPGSQYRSNKRSRQKCRRVEHYSVDVVVAVYFISSHVEEETPTISDQRSAEIASVVAILERRPERCERIASVERFVIETEIKTTVKSIRPGLSDDLDAGISALRELSRVRILIYVDSQDRFFRRMLPALAKTPDVDRRVIGATGSSGHLFQR